jgi:hypothetical protein
MWYVQTCIPLKTVTTNIALQRMPPHSPPPPCQDVPRTRRLLSPQPSTILQLRQWQRTQGHQSYRQLSPHPKRDQKRPLVCRAFTTVGRVSPRQRHHGQDIIYRGAQPERHRRSESGLTREREEVMILPSWCLRVLFLFALQISIPI